MSSTLECRCTFTIERRSKGYVEDAMFYARWILRLRAATGDDRLRMLAELDDEPLLPDLKQGDPLPPDPAAAE
jgi:hypothetical protein